MGLFDRFKSKKSNDSEQLKNLVAKMHQLAFPGGEAQIESEAVEIYELLGGKVSHRDAKAILLRSKSLLVIAQDKSEERIASSIFQSAREKLSREDAKAVYRHLAGDTEVHTPSGDGSSMEEAIVINATSAILAVPAQYEWLASNFGVEGQDYVLGVRMHLSDDNGRSYTMHELTLRSGEQRQVFFDVTASM